jgi:hypothetical protein
MLNLAVLVDEDAIFIAIKNFLPREIGLLSVHRDHGSRRGILSFAFTTRVL